jgi:DNA polymerase (family 10)
VVAHVLQVARHPLERRSAVLPKVAHPRILSISAHGRVFSTCSFVSHARLAGAAGVLIPVNTDAHTTASLSYAELGVAVARRAWLTKEQVLNTRPWAEIERMRG